MSTLTSEVLGEVPDQVVEYMVDIANKKPGEDLKDKTKKTK